MTESAYRRLALLTLLLCLGVVVLGAYVRLSDAGLGCPDWPGCYGRVLVPADPGAALAAYPERPLESAKAWKEMVHRYLASALGLCILALAVMGWRKRRAPRGLLAGMVALVVFQGILGMWTVTWQLKPLAVTGHLLGGMSTLALLAWLNARLRAAGPPTASVGLRRFAGFALLALFAQIFLGGWTSSNYAALACPDFPTCHAQFWPDADFSEAFVLWRGLGVNYEYGVLDGPARTAIHLTHRLGAIIVTLILASLAVALWRGCARPVLGVVLLLGLVVQLGLGIVSVLGGLPLPVAAAHNAGAAILVLILMVINEYLWRRSST